MPMISADTGSRVTALGVWDADAIAEAAQAEVNAAEAHLDHHLLDSTGFLHPASLLEMLQTRVLPQIVLELANDALVPRPEEAAGAAAAAVQARRAEDAAAIDLGIVQPWLWHVPEGGACQRYD